MAKTKQTARKTNTLGMFTYQNDSTSSSSSGEEMDTDAEGSRQEGNKSRYNRPIFTGEEGKVTQAPEGERVKCKVILEYSSNEVSESQLDQIHQEYPTAANMDRIKKVKRNVKLIIPCHPSVEGLTDSFIAWYKDHGMTISLRKALLVNRWMEQMIQEFKREYIRKYKISQGYAVRYPDEKLSIEDELEGDGLADLVGPGKKTSLKDAEKEAEGPKPKRTTKKKRARKTTLQEPSRVREKKAIKCQRGQGNETKPMTSEPLPQKKQKGEGKKKKRQVEADTDESILRKKEAKGTPSTALGRAPDAEPPPAPGVLLRAAPTPMGQKSSLDKQLHLLGTEPLSAVVWQSQTTASSTAPQGSDMGGFLARLRKSIPLAGT